MSYVTPQIDQDIRHIYQWVMSHTWEKEKQKWLMSETWGNKTAPDGAGKNRVGEGRFTSNSWHCKGRDFACTYTHICEIRCTKETCICEKRPMKETYVMGAALKCIVLLSGQFLLVRTLIFVKRDLLNRCVFVKRDLEMRPGKEN